MKLDDNLMAMELDLGNSNKISQTWTLQGSEDRVVSSIHLNLHVRDTTPTQDEPIDHDNPLAPNYQIPNDIIRAHFGSGAANGEDFYDIRKYDATTKGLGLHNPKAGTATNGINLLDDDADAETVLIDIKTQDNAQEALVRLNDAIVQKDKIRANYGALQNRLENTLTNLTIQSENIQNAESRLSDADIAREMTEFVRNQVLTNAAVAMLSQANPLPQMVMRLIN